MKRAWTVLLSCVVMLGLTGVLHAGPKVKPMPGGKGPWLKPMPHPQLKPMPKPMPKPSPTPAPKPKPMPMPGPKGGFGKGHGHGHGHKGHGPHGQPGWQHAIPRINVVIGGRRHTETRTVIVRDPDVVPLPADGPHPAPTYIDGVAWYPYPGDGGTWVEYRERLCYAWEGKLYVLMRDREEPLPFRRTAIPEDLSERLTQDELFGQEK